ncbi:DUF721 domain-containing protein [Aeromicrobium sp. CTD01-1L150]|uniref:DUF721 domain-containing protein n=1 Tax=Aeromicrobium sp. CTD01-1L150 TaxID=3341830 RepID=UPI0035C252B9
MSEGPPQDETGQHDQDDQDPQEPAPDGDASPDPLGLARQIADSYRDGPPARHQRRRGRPTSPRRRTREDPVPLSDVLGQVVKNQGWDARISQQRVFTDWPAIVGPEIAQHTTVTDFTDGVLEVRADSTAWATQLKLLAGRLVAKLNDELGQGSVLRIEVVPPRGPSWRKGNRSVRGGRGPRDTYG